MTLAVAWVASVALGWEPVNPALSADAVFLGTTTWDVFGNRVNLGDADGDGYLDAAIGAPRQDDGGLTAGAVYLFYRPRPGVYPADATADLRLFGEAAGDFAGYALAFAGDLDGDGDGDLLVGARDHDGVGPDAGAAYAVALPQTGAVGLGASRARYRGEAGGDNAGRDVFSAGDADDDGLVDVLVTAPFHDAAGDDSGAVYVVPGSRTGDVALGDATTKWTGEAAGDNAGLRAVTFGDGDGDGRSDLAVGAQGSDRAFEDAGAVYVLAHTPSGAASLAEADAILTGEGPSDSAGSSVAPIGDLDGDGLDDLAVGADNEGVGGPESGEVYLVLAPFSPVGSLTDAATAIAGTWAGGRAGNHVARCDFDGDGGGDLLIAAHEAGDGEQRGEVYVFFGPVAPGSATTDDADLRFEGERLDNFGQDLACANLDGDGADDLLVGSEGHESAVGGYLAGAAFLFFGTVTPAPPAEGCGCGSARPGITALAPLLLLIRRRR